jgi:riboflavin transporter FmnP
MTAPYIAFNTYFRGALAEIWALMWIPLGFWITNKAMVQSRWRIVLALVAALVALTHVPSLLIFTILWLLYSLFFLFNQSWKVIVKTIITAFLGFGLVSFYLLPAILEKWKVLHTVYDRQNSELYKLIKLNN